MIGLSTVNCLNGGKGRLGPCVTAVGIMACVMGPGPRRKRKERGVPTDRGGGQCRNMMKQLPLVKDTLSSFF